MRKKKVTQKKSPNWAGAAPAFDGFQPPKRSVGLLPPVTQEARPCFARVHTRM
jgi:hypothetical protein